MLAKEQTSPMAGVHKSYVHVDTMRVHEVLADHGFIEKGYRQNKVRKPEKLGYQKHFSVFHRPEMEEGAGQYNVMLFNGHDATSALRLELGYFRFICENQLVNSQVGVRLIHRGDVIEKLNQSIPQLIKGYEDFRATKELLETIEYTPEETMSLVEEALRIRELDGAEIENEAQKGQVRLYNQRVINHARRHEDQGLNAWRVLNRIQENVIKGTPWEYMSITDKGHAAFRKLRAVTHIDRVMRFNRQLTTKAIALANIKEAV
jgi:hypothetical protein